MKIDKTIMIPIITYSIENCILIKETRAQVKLDIWETQREKQSGADVEMKSYYRQKKQEPIIKKKPNKCEFDPRTKGSVQSCIQAFPEYF